MSSVNKNLSDFGSASIPSAKGMKIGIVVSEWNTEITEALYDGAFITLIEAGAVPEDIIRVDVPGSFELPMGAQTLILNSDVEAVICLGCVIQGETRHFDFICAAVAEGVTRINLEHNIPTVFGVLTPDNMQQALDRAGGKHGNKGVEAAVTAIKMLYLKNRLEFPDRF